MNKKIIVLIFGAAGSGKNTVVKQIPNVVHIATGHMFRKHLSEKTELGLKAKGYMAVGELVPDKIVINMLLDRLSHDDCRNVQNIILDGFPRTITQAEALLQALEEQVTFKAVHLQVSEQELRSRLAGRWYCPACEATYHVSIHPTIVSNGTCTICGNNLGQRDDDVNSPSVSKRLDEFKTKVIPVMKYLRNLGIAVRDVDGEQSPSLVALYVRTALSL